MRLGTEQLLDNIRPLIRDGRYEEALEQLEILRIRNLDQLTEARFHVLMGEVLLSTGHYKHDHLDRAVDLLRRSHDNANFAMAKYLKGWQLQSLGELQDAKQCLIEAYSGFLREQDYSGAARALNRLAIISFQAGEVDQAIETLGQVKTYRQLTDDMPGVVGAQHNMASALFMSGRLGEAISIYEETAPSGDILSRRNKCVVFLCHAMARSLKGEFGVSTELLERVPSLLDGLERERAHYYEYLGWTLALKGHCNDSLEALGMGLDVSCKIAPMSALVAQIKQLMADANICLSRWNEADTCAKEALDVANRIKERVVIAACWRVFAQVEWHRGQSEKAREWFERSLDMFKKIESRYELAVTRYLAATSGLYANGERAALLYLAREYFVSEDIHHYVEKVDKALRAEPYRPIIKTAENRKVPAIIAQSGAMQRILDLAQKVAGSDRPVLLTGETGTGKDLLARYIHYHSGRSGEFVPVNTAAIPSEMIEAELFGHTKGAFTGALADRAGLMEQAAGGTLYLDEIADATPELQAKLLQVLETNQVRRLGQNKLQPISCRVIAATNHDLPTSIRENRFRLDLYHRLNHLSLAVPPLRERVGDIPLLVEHFLTTEGLVPNTNGDRAALKRLCIVLAGRSWSGNVRQLQAEMQRLVLLSDRDLTAMVELALVESGRSDEEQLVAVLAATDWNNSRAAEILGVSETAVRKRIRKYGLNR